MQANDRETVENLQMNREIKILILVALLWILLRIIEYYLMQFFILPLTWLGFSIVFLIIAINQIIKLIREKKLEKTRIIKTLFYVFIFYLTLNRWPVENVIEKVDWHILYKKRMEIVEKVQKKELNPNVSWNNWICELPFEYPIVSNGGNDIGISRNDSTQTITVKFFVFRNFFSAPSTFFIYTNDKKNIEYYNSITENSKHNWRIKENWYRIMKE